ncbi:hydrogenase expression/formation protein HupK [Ovoidimarina sediminis]|uniref:hydrogenase expression/formation protein HupK n=1 Tax=Ovoidimarina sediminis TaxID=3079856 RepID=UPI002910C3E3|nr:hydrogenase expression/formation protein HupK [Rhodophyticola sp. MJ-SS7]MDU8945445.1 hydrogenase expression/formation protein HupK [Rhodophyticola sp. MJ-SS7]
MLDAPRTPRLVAEARPGLPVAQLVTGRRVEEVAALLPRLFNLCRAAQGAAVDAALGHPVSTDGIARETLRDHLLKLHVSWPAFFGQSPFPLPDSWADGGTALRHAVFGPAGAAPATSADFFAFLRGGQGAAGVLSGIAGCFATGEATADVPAVEHETIWTAATQDNSVAARQATHPAMAGIAAATGCGPLWRAAARLYDIDDLVRGIVPPVRTPRSGEAIVPAARGLYGVRIGTEDGTVTTLDRITPTDHLLKPGGVLERALSSLPAIKAGLGPLLLDILDPCSPVRIREVQHA